jgi:hypothetical protein
MRARFCHALEYRDRLGLRLRLEHVILSKILRLRIAAPSDTHCRVLQIVERAPQHDPWPKQQPVRSRISVGHAHAARVHDASAINGAVELLDSYEECWVEASCSSRILFRFRLSVSGICGLNTGI